MSYNNSNDNYQLIIDNNIINCEINSNIIPQFIISNNDLISPTTSILYINNSIETSYIVSFKTSLINSEMPSYIPTFTTSFSNIFESTYIESTSKDSFNSLYTTIITSYTDNMNKTSDSSIINSTLIISNLILSTIIQSFPLIKTTSLYSELISSITTSIQITSSSLISITNDSLTLIPIIIKTDLYSIINNVETTIISQEMTTTEKINITKEKIIDELRSIIDKIEIGKIYEKIGDDYSIFIYPTNSTNLLFSTYVNFSKCETILRNHYKIPDSSIMTFLQIELKNENSQSLINQVEYQAYDGNKTILDLSLCDGVNINIFYSIKNNSLIDVSTANNFKNLGIDIFNINDSFFNDICQPYSESNNDLILEDRIKDIYQNYSLCEEG